MMPLAAPEAGPPNQLPAHTHPHVSNWHPQVQMLRRQPIRSGSSLHQNTTSSLPANLLCV